MDTNRLLLCLACSIYVLGCHANSGQVVKDVRLFDDDTPSDACPKWYTLERMVVQISYCPGRAGDAITTSLNLQRGEIVKNIKFLYSVREYVKPSEYLRFLTSVSFRGIVTGRMCAEGLRRGLEQR